MFLRFVTYVTRTFERDYQDYAPLQIEHSVGNGLGVQRSHLAGWVVVYHQQRWRKLTRLLRVVSAHGRARQKKTRAITRINSINMTSRGGKVTDTLHLSLEGSMSNISSLRTVTSG